MWIVDPKRFVDPSAPYKSMPIIHLRKTHPPIAYVSDIRKESVGKSSPSLNSFHFQQIKSYLGDPQHEGHASTNMTR